MPVSPCYTHKYFWDKVIVTDSCWLWTAKLSADGYPRFWDGQVGQFFQAHRWLWEQMVGPIDDGLQLDHLCRTRNCVRPSHLEPVTPGENSRRATSLITQCPQGHGYDEKNTYLDNGKRACRACKADYARRAYVTRQLTPEQTAAKSESQRQRRALKGFQSV